MPRYIAGWNMPGYLPETEPEGFDTFAQAVAYLVDTVERFWDEDYADADAEADVHDARENVDDKWLPVHTALDSAAPAHDLGTSTFQEYTGDRQYVFWIEPATGPDPAHVSVNAAHPDENTRYRTCPGCGRPTGDAGALHDC